MPSHIYNMDGPRDDIAKLTETNTIGFHSFVGFKGKKKSKKKETRLIHRTSGCQRGGTWEMGAVKGLETTFDK